MPAPIKLTIATAVTLIIYSQVLSIRIILNVIQMTNELPFKILMVWIRGIRCTLRDSRQDIVAVSMSIELSNYWWIIKLLINQIWLM